MPVQTRYCFQGAIYHTGNPITGKPIPANLSVTNQDFTKPLNFTCSIKSPIPLHSKVDIVFLRFLESVNFKT